ncbi:MAG: TIGR04283 family arsenosugar biosynthesis glycosyltransferase [Nitrospirae bacterium]|nr:TIGR04283 family arsenosugar biosynthesis glycosyltransferase [Nitrospirota bacterium]
MARANPPAGCRGAPEVATHLGGSQGAERSPVISIIIPVLNEAGGIRDCLEHVRSLRGGKEIVVVDGGRSDGTADIVRRLVRTRSAKLKLIRSEPGRARQMNRGASDAKGDILLFLHADSRLPGNALSVVENACRTPDVVGGRFDLRLDAAGVRFRLTEKLINIRSRASRLATGDQCIFVKRKIFERMGGYAEIPLMEDVELCSRLRQMGRFVALAERATTSARRWEKNGFARTVLLMWSLRGLYALGAPPPTLARWYVHIR